MTSFTDEDLKRLKEYVETPMDYPVVNINQAKMRALIARLEMAERVCERAERTDILPVDLKAWRAASGKS